MPLPVRVKKRLFAFSIALWLVAAVWGAHLLHAHSFTPGATGQPAGFWPAEAGFSQPDGVCTLVVALHPECPCSRATLSELAVLLDKTTPHLRAVVILLDTASDQPANNSALFKTASQLPDVTLICDRDGSELQRFHFVTSGETRLYQPDGALVFRGGITPSRGHAGYNPGRATVLSLVRATTPASAQTPVRTPAFGCALFVSADTR